MRRTRTAAALLAGATVLAVAACAPAPSVRPAVPAEAPSPVAGASEREMEADGPGAGRLSAGEGQGERELEAPTVGGKREGREAETAVDQMMQQRLAPTGAVPPGAYGKAAAAWAAMPATVGTWSHVTSTPYNSDDQRFAGAFSNAGSGFDRVSGRVDALVSDGPYLYAASSSGGVWRQRDGRAWEPIGDGLPALSAGAMLQDGKRGWLWLATGDAATAGVARLGTGVYAMASPRTGSFSEADRVGGAELESTGISSLVLSPNGSTVYAATSRGLWSHPAGTRAGGWTLLLAPSPDYLPAFPTASPARKAGALYRDPSAPYRNWVDAVAVDPRDARHLVAAAGWRGGPPLPIDPDGGMYESRDGGRTWSRTTLGGVFAPDDVGTTRFQPSADGSRLYAVVQSPRLLNAGAVTMLLGVFVSASGNPAGPWQQVASGESLGASGSTWSVVGFQSWYNQFLAVDPADSRHVYLGLEEVSESTDGGATWRVVGPYWNFPFDCWDPAKPQTPRGVNGCPTTTHADQHAAVFGTRGGKAAVFIGGDGGVYTRPSPGRVDALGHATDWTSLNDGSIDTLQYYGIGVGKVSASNPGARALGWKSGVIVSGGLQDNGQSILRVGDRSMASNFGGDGGETFVDPQDGCHVVQEYVYLTMKVATNCATSLDATPQYSIKPTGETAARFIAPFAADPANTSSWIAGGRTVWTQSKGFAITSGADWTAQYDLGTDPSSGTAHVATAVALSGRRAYVGWCGPCDSVGFSRGIATGLVGDPGSWRQLALAGTPNRYITSIDIDPASPSKAVAAFSGFSRTWTEGPGSGYGHLYLTTDAGARWKDVSGSLPDVPVDIVRMAGSTYMVGTDLGAAVSRDSGRTWSRLGSGLPLTVVTDLIDGPDGRTYAGTFGRGIWSLPSR